MQKEKKKKEEISIEEYIAAEEELKTLKKEYGIEDDGIKDENPKKEGRISRKVSSFFERQEGREPVAVNKKKYIWLAVLTGWFGGHRFYCKHYRVGILYLLFCWIGLGMCNTIIDLMVVIPMQADENGNVYL